MINIEIDDLFEKWKDMYLSIVLITQTNYKKIKRKQKMVNNRYARAYTEVLEIIKYFPKDEYSKIPTEKIEFYKNNMDRDYNFIINPEVDLSEQNISKEANAIIVNLFLDYFATEEQKTKINEILDLNQRKEEEEKREKYNPNDLFKKNNEIENIQENEQEKDLIEYKENFFIKFKNFIIRLLHLKNKE